MIRLNLSKISETANIFGTMNFFFIDLLLFCPSTDDLKVFEGTEGWHAFRPLLNHQVAFELGEEEVYEH